MIDRGDEPGQRRLAAERAAALVEVPLELVAELRDVARDDDRRGVAERAEALAQDPVADVEEQVELALRGAALLDPSEDVDLPADALAARRALAAGLLLVELREAQAELHHAAAVVDDDEGRRRRTGSPPSRSRRSRRWRRSRRRQDRRRRAARDHRLEAAAVRDAAAEVRRRSAPGSSPCRARSRSCRLARRCRRASRGACRSSSRRRPSRTPRRPCAHDLRHRRHRLDVVDLGRRRVQPLDGGNGGFVRGLPRLPSSESRSAVSSPQM